MSRRSLIASAALGLCLLSACAASYLSRAPASPATAWRPATSGPHDFSLAPEPALSSGIEGRATSAAHAYDLPELIDIAESTNPDTRIAWERARQAALAVGLARAEYLPTISALALAAYHHTLFPVPSLVKSLVSVIPSLNLPGVSFPVPPLTATSGHVGVDTFHVLPFLAIRWQVLDLGRGAKVEAAEHASDAANLAFTGEHQKVVLHVSTAYFRLGAARALVAVARDTLERTARTAKAAEARLGRGLATTIEVAEARREIAQAEYALAEARAVEVADSTGLLAAMGLDARVPLEIATSPSRNLPLRLEYDMDTYVQAALKTRPDLQAALAQRAAAHAQIATARGTFLPRVSVMGVAGVAVLGSKLDGGPFNSATLPNFGGSVNLEWLLFDFGVRDAVTEVARSQRNEAEQLLAKLQREAAHQVVAAYDEVNAALARYQAASALERTAAVAEDAVTKSYASGLSTFTELLNAQKARSIAAGMKEQAFADALVSATALVFASGQLGSAKAVPELR